MVGPELLHAIGLAPAQAVPAGLTRGALRVVGLALLALTVAIVLATVYRWYARDKAPEGVAVLVSLAAVAVFLNTTAALGQVLGGGTSLLDPDEALVNTLIFLVAGVAGMVGRQAGDHLARELLVVTGARDLDVELSRLDRTVGRVMTVTLPATADDIEDIVGYDPVPPETKATLAEKTLVFPRGLTVAQLRERVVERLRDDYAIGHVDLELDADGTVTFLAVGSRAAGIGPTLAPGTAATAVRADPAFAASAGDVVQLWAEGESPARVATAELRATAGDVVTVALDEADAADLDPLTGYRLLTLPSEPRADRDFARLLRGADETMGVVTVTAGSELDGTTAGALTETLIAVRGPDGDVEALPRRDWTLVPGAELFVIARPETLRRLERRGLPPEAESS